MHHHRSVTKDKTCQQLKIMRPKDDVDEVRNIPVSPISKS